MFLQSDASFVFIKVAHKKAPVYYTLNFFFFLRNFISTQIWYTNINRSLSCIAFYELHNAIQHISFFCKNCNFSNRKYTLLVKITKYVRFWEAKFGIILMCVHKVIGTYLLFVLQ